jgi:hypothetical protein
MRQGSNIPEVRLTITTPKGPRVLGALIRSGIQR